MPEDRFADEATPIDWQQKYLDLLERVSAARQQIARALHRTAYPIDRIDLEILDRILTEPLSQEPLP